MAEEFNPTPRTLEENLALIKKIRAMSGAYGQNQSNYGGGAQLRSTFDLEGPEALGAGINIPALDDGFGADDRRSVLGRLGYGASNLPSIQSAIRDRLLEKTSGSESFNLPVEKFSFDEEGNFLTGLIEPQNNMFGFATTGDLPTEGGPTFDVEDDLQAIMADLEAANREIKDNEVLPRFDQELIEGTSDGLSTRNIENVLKAESDKIDALLANNPVFDDPMEIATTIEESGGRGDINEEPGDRKKYAAEQFRKKEEELANAQGGLNSMTIAESDKSKKQLKKLESEDAFMAGMDDFIRASRGENPTGPEEKTIEQYKEEFSKATGIDVSGKVDKSQALMAFGLALMQNKAGKGFNVGKMLTSVSEAGESAMPELAAARKEAKQASLSAGKFALEMQSSDESKRKSATEKAMNRTQYYVMPKGEGVNGFIKNIDRAKSQRLNVFELNALTSNPEFDENFEVISADNYTKLAEKLLEGPEAVESFSSTKTPMRLFEGKGVNSMFTLSIFDVNPNNPDAPSVGRLSGGIESADPIYRELISSLKSLNEEDAKMAKAVSLAGGSAAETGSMILNWAKGIGNKLGFDIEGNTETDQLKFFLNRMATENATEILGESGKTLSDGDRKRVDQLIGELSLIKGDNPAAMVAKLKEFREKIIVKKRNEILRAFQTLDKYSRQDYSQLYNDGNFSSEDEEEYELLLKKYKKK
tara:strand:+ start:398 stop:2506 length:2109 start_codon:yes stop_codon:yes gene_type:complete